MKTINKIVRLGRGEYGDIFCKIKFINGKLSISGVEGPLRGGDCKGSCGQIIMGYMEHGLEIDPAEGWDTDKIETFLNYWDQWHLNDLTAGSPAQERYLAEHPIEYKYPQSHYDAACQALESAELNPDPDFIYNDKPYKYGHAWLFTKIPDDVIEFLDSLPETDKEPAWV